MMTVLRVKRHCYPKLSRLSESVFSGHFLLSRARPERYRGPVGDAGLADLSVESERQYPLRYWLQTPRREMRVLRANPSGAKLFRRPSTFSATIRCKQHRIAPKKRRISSKTGWRGAARPFRTGSRQARGGVGFQLVITRARAGDSVALVVIVAAADEYEHGHQHECDKETGIQVSHDIPDCWCTGRTKMGLGAGRRIVVIGNSGVISIRRSTSDKTRNDIRPVISAIFHEIVEWGRVLGKPEAELDGQLG